MGEKVVLTKEQAEAIESALKFEKGDKDRVLRLTSRTNVTWQNGASRLNEIDLALLAKALYIGYKVEETFKPGDKVVRVDGSCFTGFKDIETVERAKFGSVTLSNHLQYSYDFIRHATPEEIYWLETLGREKVGDFRNWDVLIDKAGVPHIIFAEEGVEYALEQYQENSLAGIYPAESFKPFPKEESK